MWTEEESDSSVSDELPVSDSSVSDELSFPALIFVGGLISSSSLLEELELESGLADRSDSDFSGIQMEDPELLEDTDLRSESLSSHSTEDMLLELSSVVLLFFDGKLMLRVLELFFDG